MPASPAPGPAPPVWVASVSGFGSSPPCGGICALCAGFWIGGHRQLIDLLPSRVHRKGNGQRSARENVSGDYFSRGRPNNAIRLEPSALLKGDHGSLVPVPKLPSTPFESKPTSFNFLLWVLASGPEEPYLSIGIRVVLLLPLQDFRVCLLWCKRLQNSWRVESECKLKLYKILFVLLVSIRICQW